VNLLLDTHVFIWWNSDASRLGKAAAAAIADPANETYVSAASVWEIAVKRQLGRLSYAGSPIEAIERCGFLTLPILPAHAELVGSLPLLHVDPFDRMLVVQAQFASLTLVTSDRKVAAYAVPQLWAG
jgi:PIN domain nuclease of toxin-antitoxin system